MIRKGAEAASSKGLLSDELKHDTVKSGKSEIKTQHSVNRNKFMVQMINLMSLLFQ